ncbi:hypothetical protein BKA61DRAFT_614689 [Leptodontidium sp. MPI-SDFR-AT-0119]|nr:hypothetical protein BKA61DRAFT_614689 [Leptodontidium sp. MPI-SDFR-AT-0119]
MALRAAALCITVSSTHGFSHGGLPPRETWPNRVCHQPAAAELHPTQSVPRLTKPRFPLVFKFQMSMHAQFLPGPKGGPSHLPEAPEIVNQIPKHLVPYDMGSCSSEG